MRNFILGFMAFPFFAASVSAANEFIRRARVGKQVLSAIEAQNEADHPDSVFTGPTSWPANVFPGHFDNHDV